MPPLPRTRDIMEEQQRQHDDGNDDDELMEEEQEEEETMAVASSASNEFLDSFYGITSSDPQERATASQVLLQHALTNHSDASYCLDRLFKGLCSGRAAARQGNAACLASCLRRLPLADLRGEEDVTDAAFVLRRLRYFTEPSVDTAATSRRKGSEERDYQFGRLFGINAVVRSGILWRTTTESSSSAADTTIQPFVQDLVALYRQKRWLREPVAHAVCTLLQSLLASGADQGDDEEEKARDIATALVSNVVIPELLIQGDMEVHRPSQGEGSLVQYSAEQLALAFYLRSIRLSALPACPLLDQQQSLLASVPQFVEALNDTSAVIQPRTHLVWDTLWMVLTEPTDTDPKVDVRRPKEDSDVVVQAIWEIVVVERLVSATHEKRALAMCLLRNLSGVEFMSSLTGRTRLVLPTDTLVKVWTFDTVQRLLLHVVCSTSKHILRPLAMTTLEQVTEAVAKGEPQDRWTMIRTLLECEPRFDARTKTKTIEKMLGLDSGATGALLFQQYMTFLETHIIGDSSVSSASQDSNKRIGFMDLMFQAIKAFVRRSDESSNEGKSEKIDMLQQSLAFFACMAFFRANDVTRKEDAVMGGMEGVDRAVSLFSASKIPHAMRSVASARFYSLVADRVAELLRSSTGDKETVMLQFMVEVQAIQQRFLDLGAPRIQSNSMNESNEEDEDTPSQIVAFLHEQAQKTQKSEKATLAERKWAESCSVMGFTLQLHMLSCGPSETDNENDDPDQGDDEDEDAEEISSMLDGIKTIYKLLSGKPDDGSQNAGTLLADLCVTILTSPIGSSRVSRGASPTLLREVVKRFWINGLTLFAQREGTFDIEAASILLQGIGIDIDEPMDDGSGDDGSDEDTEEEEEEEEETSGSAKADSDSDERSDENRSQSDQNLDQEIEIDDEKLQSMMLEDSDAEIDEAVLEHHEQADAALAKFIQMKQDARKAGQVARERIALASQMRCMMLLETFAVGKSETWGSLLTTDVILRMIAEIAEFRRVMVRSLEKATGVIAGEKRSFVDRLMNLLKAKLLKAKVSGWREPAESERVAQEFTAKLTNLTRKSVDKDHHALCATAFLFLFRHTEHWERSIDQAESTLGEVVDEWATKRTTKIETCLLDTLVHQGPVISQVALLPSIVKAATTARSSYLKTESYRLLSALFNPKLNRNTSELEKAATRRLVQCVEPTLGAFTSSFDDIEMKKSKRLREVLKAAEKFSQFVLTLEPVPSASWEKFQNGVAQLKDNSESSAVSKAATKLSDIIESILVTLEQQSEATKHPEGRETVEQEAASNVASKKKKKKKKKGKR